MLSLEVTMFTGSATLFPLNVVLLPGADMPLHIFEPRYRQMVRDCLDAKAPFGMLLALPNESQEPAARRNSGGDKSL